MTGSRTYHRILVALLALLLAGIAAVLLSGSRQPASSSPPPPSRSQFDGPTLPAGLSAPSFSLTDQSGQRVDLSQYRGRVVALTFIHSLCQDACPLMIQDIKGALNLLPNGGRGVAAVGITAEPSQDTPANRRLFVARMQMSGRMSYLNGSHSDLQRIWSSYHVAPVLPGQPEHSAFVFLIDKRGVERVGWPVDQLTPEQLAHDLRVLERETA